MKRNNLIKKKKFNEIIGNKNYSEIRFGRGINKIKKKDYTSINYYSKNKEKYFNNIEKYNHNLSKRRNNIKQNIIYNLKYNINKLVNDNLINKNILRPKTPFKNISFKQTISNKYEEKNGGEIKKNDNNNIEFSPKNHIKIDNIDNKSLSSKTRFHRNRSARNIKSIGLNIFKKQNRINNSNFNFKSYDIITNYYLKNKNQNKQSFNNTFMNEYKNKTKKLPNDNYLNSKIGQFSKDKNTQTSVNKHNNKNNKIGHFSSSIYSNNVNTNIKNNIYLKKILLIKEQNNNKYENNKNNKIIYSKDKIKKIKLISTQSRNKLLKDNLNYIYFSKTSEKDLSLSKKIKISNVDPTGDIQGNNNEDKKVNNLINNNEKEKEKKLYNKINIESKGIFIKDRIKGYDAITQAGIDKNFCRKINQDNYIISTNINNIKNFNIFGVLDGHGLYGHLISIFVGKYILNSFINNNELKPYFETEELYLKLKENNFKIINDIFINAEKELYFNDFDSNFSGTTCIIVIEVGEHIICANSGDSRAILIYTDKEKFDNYIQKIIIENESKKEVKEFNKNNSNYQIKNIIKPFSDNRRSSSSSLTFDKKKKNILKKKNKIWKLLTKIFCLSNDLKPTDPLEKKRIYENGGRVEQLKEKDGTKNGPLRVWVKGENYPGLAMSRSIGDFIASSVGVIPDPEIIEYTLDINSRYMILATDGIWEFLSNEKVMKIGNKFYPKYEPIDLCNELVKEANKCWEQEEVVRDDITVLVVYF